MIKTTLVILCFSIIAGACICNANSMSISKKSIDVRGILPDVASVSSDINFSSPEETWAHFKNALIDGNYESAKDCYTSSNKNRVNLFKKIGVSKTQKLIRQIKSIENVHLEKDKAKYQVVKDMQGVELITYVYFVKINNEWKIEKF